MQGQADGGVGVQGDGEVAGQQVSGAGGDEGHGHLGAGQLGGDGAHGAVAARHHDQVDAGLQGAVGHGTTGVVRGGLQPDGGTPAGGVHFRGDTTAQEREVVELGGVVDDGGALLAAGARQATVDQLVRIASMPPAHRARFAKAAPRRKPPMRSLSAARPMYHWLTAVTATAV